MLTVILAFVSYLATYLSAQVLARRKDKLELVNRRLNEFYGPLYVASQLRSYCATASACDWKPSSRSWTHSTRPSR